MLSKCDRPLALLSPSRTTMVPAGTASVVVNCNGAASTKVPVGASVLASIVSYAITPGSSKTSAVVNKLPFKPRFSALFKIA